MIRAQKSVLSVIMLLVLFAGQTAWCAPMIAQPVKPLQSAASINTPVVLVSGNRMTPLVIAAQMAGPAVVGVTNKGEIMDPYNKKIEFEGFTLYNINASIVYNLQAPLLLGQSVLEKLGEILINYENNTLTIFK